MCAVPYFKKQFFSLVLRIPNTHTCIAFDIFSLHSFISFTVVVAVAACAVAAAAVVSCLKPSKQEKSWYPKSILNLLFYGTYFSKWNMSSLHTSINIFGCFHAQQCGVRPYVMTTVTPYDTIPL